MISKTTRDHSVYQYVKKLNNLQRRFSTKFEDHCSDEYQFMQRSKLPTMYFQRSLPRLPIPLLAKTCERFLAAVRPLTTDEQYTATQKIVEDFHKGIGMDLNARLKIKDAANKHTSYISEPWFEMYLTDRAPLPLNYNPLLVMKNETNPNLSDQLVRSSNLVISSLRFWRSLQSNILEPEVYHLNKQKSDTDEFRRLMRIAPTIIATYCAYALKAFPLDMSQYNRLFGVTRIPKNGKDELVQHADSRHILVMRRGNMYAVDVIDEDYKIEAPATIYGRLKHVIDIDNGRESAAVTLGVLTTGNRDDWARSRKLLCNEISENNKQLLENEVERALFCLCLDDSSDPQYKEEDPLPLLKHFLAGNGSNRWFDKSVSLLVGLDGTAAVNFEHSWGDGVAVLRYFNEIYKETSESPFINGRTRPAIVNANDRSVRPIDFDVSEKLQADVMCAIDKNAEIMSTLDMNMLRNPKLNKLTCKRDKVSPDSIMQLSFQLAYRQAFKTYVGTYESCSTAAFRHGRTETMRPCTIATKKFCESVLQPSNCLPSRAELRSMIDECSKVHGQLTKEAAMGQGFDRHLFALRHTATMNNLPIHDIYHCDSYKKLNHNIISTSTLSSDALLAGTFGPVVRDGLGVGYSIQNDLSGAIVTSYKNQCDGKYFVDSLSEAFEKIQNVIESK